jgi:hypothetical protein
LFDEAGGLGEIYANRGIFMKNMSKVAKLIISSLAVIVLAMASMAHAECGNLKNFKMGAMWQEQSWRGEFSAGSLLLVSDSDPIVGFWKVKFISKGNAGIPDGTVLDAAYAEWHGDGTEIMNSSRPPSTSNFCLGVWKQTALLRYKLNHFAISWDPNGNLIGPANIREEVRLSQDGSSFVGTFTIDQYDQAGNKLAHLSGQLQGKRITVDTSITDVL